MHDFPDCAQAVRTTVSLLETSGISPMTIAATLLAASVELYRRELPHEFCTQDEVKELLGRMLGSV
ncbi:MAG: hypothetical protein HYV16_11455 [Gammaproteobacteria bacterium]|nr:hypothetical protein [Gammaproteobacteria bacterium]